MNNTKAKIDFSHYAGNALGPLAHTIHDNMTAASATFTAPPVTMAAFQTLIDTFDAKLAAKASRATTDVMAYNLARHDLEGGLRELGGYVNAVALGDPAIVLASGFPSFSTTSAPAAAIPAAPMDVTLGSGDLSCTVNVRCHPDRDHAMNEAQSCTGDPNVEANWKYAGMFGGGKGVLSGFTLGSVLWVRIRTAGAGGVLGAFSDPAKIVIT